MKINVVGSIFGSSGYDSHCRGLVNALYKLNPDIALDVQRPADWERKINDQELKMLLNQYYPNETTLAIMLPHTWSIAQADMPKHFLGYCVWEGSKVPKFFLKYIDSESCHKIIVPSSHTKAAIINTLPVIDAAVRDTIMHKIEAVPHGVNTEIYKPIETPKEKFTFVANKGWAQGMNDRGGLQFLFKAFAEEFRKDEKVKLLVKVNQAYGGSSLNVPLAFAELNCPEDHAEIAVVTEEMNPNQLAHFYNSGHVFVSPNMGESFGLPIAEAMSCGLPAIVTGFGGQTDFVLDGLNGFHIPYELVENTWDVMYEGIEWAKPNIEALRKLLRFAFEHQDKMAELGKNAKELIHEKYTWENSAKRILEIITGLENGTH